MPSKRILYGVHISPPVRAVLLTLEALDLDYEFQTVGVYTGELLQPEFLKKNPQHTIPILEEEDGKCLWDSHAIMPYLVRKYGKDDSLYPKDFYQRAVVDQRLHYESGVLFALGRATVPKIIRGEAKKEDIPQMIKDVNDTYELLETFMGDNEFIAGKNLTIADFSIAATFAALVCFTPIESTKYPKLAAWFERIKTLPYYDLACAEGINEVITKVERGIAELS